MPYRDKAQPPAKRVIALLDAVSTRSELKRLARWLDTDGMELKAPIVEEARRRGVELPDEAMWWPGKRLLRRAQAREASSRVRKNPIPRDEAFVCVACGKTVTPAGRTARNHCPYCLRSLHVDVVPGDRAANCGGVMDPVGATIEGRSGVVIEMRCRLCGYTGRNRALRDTQPADEPSLLHRLLAGEAVPIPDSERVDTCVRNFRAQVLTYIRREGLISPGERVAVAVSGGVDSVVLLDAIAGLRGALGIELVVATVDHGLRASAVEDALFVRQLAAALELPIYSGRVTVQNGKGLADAARLERYAYLASVPVDRVLLAQHADDQAETVLLRVLRGTGVRGLGGMQASRGRWVRPLLEQTREDIVAYAEARGLRWREDPSNADRKRERAQVRFEALPMLERIHGDARGQLSALARAAQDQSRWAEDSADAAWERCASVWGLQRAALLEEPAPLQSLLVERLYREGTVARRSIGRTALEAVFRLIESGKPGSFVEVPGGWRIAVSAAEIHVLPPLPGVLVLPFAGRWRWGVWGLCLDGPIVAEGLSVRSLHNGEVYRGRDTREDLRAIGIPAPLRDYHPVVCRAGEPVWIPGLPVVVESSKAVHGLSIRTGRGLRCGGLQWRATL